MHISNTVLLVSDPRPNKIILKKLISDLEKIPKSRKIPKQAENKRNGAITIINLYIICNTKHYEIRKVEINSNNTYKTSKKDSAMSTACRFKSDF